MPFFARSILRVVFRIKPDFGFRLVPGFTLIEFLLVLGILTITIGSTLLFLTSILRGSNQGNVVSEVKQNGQSVLDSMDRQIRNAKTADTVAVPGAASTVRLTLSNGLFLFISCANRLGTTSNGWIGTLGPQASGVTPGSVNSFAPMTNRDTVAGVDIVCDAAGTFQVTSSSTTTNSPIVKVGFSANQGVSAPSRVDFLANVRFDTTISLRQY